MHRYARCYAYADGGNLSFTLLIADPDTGTAINSLGLKAKLTAYLDETGLNFANETNELGGLCQFNDGVANELARTVPCDLSTAINVDYWSSIMRLFGFARSLSGRVDRRMFKKQKGVGANAFGYFFMNKSLSFERCCVLDKTCALNRQRGVRNL
jgi:hypothetical protein